MGKYVIVQDMRTMPCYKNINARLLYLHVCMGCDIGTYTYATSLRRLAMELDMTLDTVRHALKVLQRDGLLVAETAPQPAPQGAPQRTPQRTPHLTILKIMGNGTPNGTPNTTPNTTPSTTENTTVINNNNNNTESLTHDVRVCARVKTSALAVLDLPAGEVEKLFSDFQKRQGLKKKVWQDESDLTAHFIAWAEKRLPRPQMPRKTKKESDYEARQAEYQRQKEEYESRSEIDKLRDEWQRLQHYLADFKKRGDEENAAAVEAELHKIRKKANALQHAS